MKIFKSLASTLLLIFTVFAMGASAQAAPTQKKNSQKKSQLGTSFKFDGSSLHGKYQTTPSTTATVENDKYLDDLLGARKNFNDRMAKDSDRN